MPFLNIAVSSSIIGNESFLVCFLNMWSFFTCDTHESWQKNWGPPRYKSYNFWCYSLAPQTLESCAGIDKFPMRELFSCNSITQHISHVIDWICGSTWGWLLENAESHIGCFNYWKTIYNWFCSSLFCRETLLKVWLDIP